jgi:hypothetical protein
MSVLATALARVKRAREICGDAVLVSLSGKDSMVSLDLCCQVFSRVEAYHMYFVRGLRCVEDHVDAAARRHGVPVHYVPHWDLARHMKYGILRNPVNGAEKIRIMAQRDVDRAMTKKTGIYLFATGERASDSFIRRFYTRENDGLRIREHRSKVYPIWDWRDADVYAYMKAKKIPSPPKVGVEGRKTSGICLAPYTCRWLAEKHPKDWAKVLEVFPYAVAMLFAPEGSDASHQAPEVPHEEGQPLGHLGEQVESPDDQ